MQLSAKHVWRSYTMFMYAAVSPACILCVCYAVIGCNTWTLLCLKRENIYIRSEHEKCIIGSRSYKHWWSRRKAPNLMMAAKLLIVLLKYCQLKQWWIDCDLSSWKLKQLANIMEQMRLYEINWNWSEPCFLVIGIWSHVYIGSSFPLNFWSAICSAALTHSHKLQTNN